MRPMRRQAAALGRGLRRIRKQSGGLFSRRMDRRTGICARTLHREPHRAAPDGLLGLRLLHAGSAAKPPDRAWTSRTRLGGPCAPSRRCKHRLPGNGSTSRRGPWPQWGRVSPGDADHLPLYRQSQIFDREGLDIDRSTLADWVGKSTALLEPLADAIHCPAGDACIAERGAACADGSGDLCRRHPGRYAGVPLPGRRLHAIAERGHRQDPDGAALGLRP